MVPDGDTAGGAHILVDEADDLVFLEMRILQHFRRHTGSFTHQPAEQMLRSDVSVTELSGDCLRKFQRMYGFFSEFKHVFSSLLILQCSWFSRKRHMSFIRTKTSAPREDFYGPPGNAEALICHVL